MSAEIPLSEQDVISIRVDDMLFKCQRSHLVMVSDYFRVMLEGSFSESQTNVIDLSNVISEDAFKVVCAFWFRKPISITWENIAEVYAGSGFFGIEKLRATCVRFCLREFPEIDYPLFRLYFALTVDSHPVITPKIVDHFARYINKVIDSPCFIDLSLGDLTLILKEVRERSWNHDAILRAVSSWAMIHADEDLEGLFALVDFDKVHKSSILPELDRILGYRQIEENSHITFDNPCMKLNIFCTNENLMQGYELAQVRECTSQRWKATNKIHISERAHSEDFPAPRVSFAYAQNSLLKAFYRGNTGDICLQSFCHTKNTWVHASSLHVTRENMTYGLVPVDFQVTTCLRNEIVMTTALYDSPIKMFRYDFESDAWMQYAFPQVYPNWRVKDSSLISTNNIIRYFDSHHHVFRDLRQNGWLWQPMPMNSRMRCVSYYGTDTVYAVLGDGLDSQLAAFEDRAQKWRSISNEVCMRNLTELDCEDVYGMNEDAFLTQFGDSLYLVSNRTGQNVFKFDPAEEVWDLGTPFDHYGDIVSVGVW